MLLQVGAIPGKQLVTISRAAEYADVGPLEERIDRRIKVAVAAALAEPTISERIRDRFTRRNSTAAERIFPSPEDGPDAA